MSLSESELDLARRVDWRFLLPTAELGRVACVGPLDGRLMRAASHGLQTILSVDVVEERYHRRGRRPGGDWAETRPGGRSPPSGGWVYVESTGRDRRSNRGRARAPGTRSHAREMALAWVRRLCRDRAARRAGGGSPLPRPQKARTTSRVKAASRSCFHRRGARPDRAHASVVARQPGGDGPSSSYVSAFLSETPALRLPERVVQAGVAGLLLTPGFETSRHVIALLVPRGDIHRRLSGRHPVSPATERRSRPKRPCYRTSEARGGPAAPRIVAFEEVHGRPLLLEAAIVGTPMNPEGSRRRSRRLHRAGLGWLAGLPVTADAADEAAFERLLAEPLARFAAAAGPRVRGLVDRTRAAVEPLRQARVPLVFEHGDLGHPNLLVQADGSWRLSTGSSPSRPACRSTTCASSSRTWHRPEERATFPITLRRTSAASSPETPGRVASSTTGGSRHLPRARRPARHRDLDAIRAAPARENRRRGFARRGDASVRLLGALPR